MIIYDDYENGLYEEYAYFINDLYGFSVPGRFVVFGYLHLWNGVRKIIFQGDSLDSMLFALRPCGIFSVEIIGKDLIVKDAHHDGTNEFVCRYVPGVKKIRSKNFEALFKRSRKIAPLVSEYIGL